MLKFSVWGRQMWARLRFQIHFFGSLVHCADSADSLALRYIALIIFEWGGGTAISRSTDSTCFIIWPQPRSGKCREWFLGNVSDIFPEEDSWGRCSFAIILGAGHWARVKFHDINLVSWHGVTLNKMGEDMWQDGTPTYRKKHNNWFNPQQRLLVNQKLSKSLKHLKP